MKTIKRDPTLKKRFVAALFLFVWAVVVFGASGWGLYHLGQWLLGSLGWQLVLLTATPLGVPYLLWYGFQEARRRLFHRVLKPPFHVRLRQRLALYGRYTFSLLLDAIAGYGYKPARGLVCYAAIILSFAIAYTSIGNGGASGLPWNEALVFSVTAFHGRGFFPGASATGLDSPITALAAVEAVLGLLIEASFIATFTQRFLSR